MCGIVGLFIKDQALRPRLGALLAEMLAELSDRGPDSAGFAVYREGTEGGVKLTLAHDDPGYDWHGLASDLSSALGAGVDFERHGTHAVLRFEGEAGDARAWLARHAPGVRITSEGAAIEIYKEKGRPEAVVRHLELARFSGTHGLGHTRMATESAVTTQGSHPFSTGPDQCLVHNGSLSNYNRLRRSLARHGIPFETENDSEVAAGYLTYRLSAGATLKEALEAGLTDLDGFYTFAIGTRDGFAVVRDRIACKPAVLAETGQWVAMASEFRAIAHLPGIDEARLWEPEPGVVYSWSRNGAA